MALLTPFTELFSVRHPIALARTREPWGVGFLSWAVGPATVERALERGPHAVMLSFGDPRPLAGPVKRAGVKLIVQVTDLDEARQAMEVEADVGSAGTASRRSLSRWPSGDGPLNKSQFPRIGP